MICSKCGNNNVEGANFCTNCASPLNQPPAISANPQTGSITITRPKKFLGCAVPYTVYIDGYLIGTVKNNQSVSFPVYYGNHNIRINCGMGIGESQFVINDEYRHLVFNCPMRLGAFSNTIDINLVGYQK